ncbi:hypothetical protein PMI10_03939 [Flavobacterium sp. CF136]|nr:hypothetical protein PMI10_03939 [Flavobacterium sp. CF136]
MGYIKKLFYKSEVQFDNDKFTIRIILTNVFVPIYIAIHSNYG